MSQDNTHATIHSKKTALGIEFGSTRIKAVLIDENHTPIASGSHNWENRLEDGVWTYHLDDVFKGLQDCYQSLAEEVKEKYGILLEEVGAIGFSGMMHGYMAFDRNGSLLAPFRTWRNTMTSKATKELTALFNFNIPHRWSIAHLYQSILDNEEHVKEIDFITTLAGYVHWQLTGEKAIGIDDASGMFPIDSKINNFDAGMIAQFDEKIAPLSYSWKLGDVLPRVMTAGEQAGVLTAKGARLIDPTGTLKPGILLCPPEGDAGTGMVATNAVAPRTGNISAGTSIFSMIVLEKALSKVYSEIDMVTTPEGHPVAMVHCNNCTSEVNAWANLFREFADSAGIPISNDDLYGLLFRKALEGDADCDDVLCCGYLAGEPITNLEEGRPLLVRQPHSRLTLSNFMRSQLFSTVATLRIGMDILFQSEKVHLDKLIAHGGLFRTPEVGQRVLAASMGVPVSVMETAGEGGAWGIAILAAYMMNRSKDETLNDYLSAHVFKDMPCVEITPSPEDLEGFNAYMKRYRQMLLVEGAAVTSLR